MSRPTEFFIEDETVYWYVSIVDVDGTPLDADSDPTLVYRRANGTGTTTTGVGVTKVAGTTGLYQFRHNTSLDTFLVPNTPIHYEEIAIINGTTYYNRWTSMIRSVATLADQTAIKAKTDQLTFTVANQVDANSLTGGTSPSAVADAVWDEMASHHNVGGSFGKFLRQVKEGLIVEESQVDDSSATTTSFVTTLPKAVDDFYNDDTLVFISGNLIGQSRIIHDYDGGDLRVTFDEPLTSAPADSDEFILLAGHNHSKTQIENTIWDAQTSDHALPGSTGEAVASAASEVSVILPATGTVPKRNQGETIQVYNQEEITVAVAVFDLAGNPVDLSTTGLWFGVWDRSKNMVTTATPTGTVTGFTVVIPKLDRIGSGLTWVVRDSSATGQVILTGPFDILSRPYQ